MSVMIEFEISDDLGNAARHRLVRSVIETPTSEDGFERRAERVRLLRITAAGEEDVADPEGMINALVPPNGCTMCFSRTGMTYRHSSQGRSVLASGRAGFMTLSGHSLGSTGSGRLRTTSRMRSRNSAERFRSREVVIRPLSLLN